ncbi:hypothetical protein [Streptomyces nigrescens]|uniref:hypothetical protein n=1 Tax=Streptomyces nigrescens TaxID=1920 RepID=UPI0036CB857A
MPNPFGSWQAGVIIPDANGRFAIPLPVLVQSALTGTVDDQITEHADELFAGLDDLGEEAWRDACLLLTEYIHSGGHYGSGEKAAERYLKQQPAPSPELPVLSGMHCLNANYIRTGKDCARGFLSVMSGDTLRGITRYQFCVAAGSSGYPREKAPALMDALCVDADGTRLR